MKPNADGTAVIRAAPTKPPTPTEAYDGRRGEIARLQEHFEHSPFPARGIATRAGVRHVTLVRLPGTATGVAFGSVKTT